MTLEDRARQIFDAIFRCEFCLAPENQCRGHLQRYYAEFAP